MRSAGILLFRAGDPGIEVFLVHPGGPFYARKDAGVWSLPKGEVDRGEDPFRVACREFHEETGQTVDACGGTGIPVPLGTVRLRSGKIVEAWAVSGDWPSGAVLESNRFAMEWPPGSGGTHEFPEVDRGQFFPLAEARTRIHPAQGPFLDRLLEHLENQGS